MNKKFGNKKSRPDEWSSEDEEEEEAKTVNMRTDG